LSCKTSNRSMHSDMTEFSVLIYFLY